MKPYRIYVSNRVNGILHPPDILDCCDDADAIDRGGQLFNGLTVEVWEGSRLVKRFGPKENRDCDEAGE